MPGTTPLGKRIKEIRNSVNLTQEQLAELIGVTKNQVSQYERGTNTPGFDILMAILYKTKASPYQLFQDYVHEDVKDFEGIKNTFTAESADNREIATRLLNILNEYDMRKK